MRHVKLTEKQKRFADYYIETGNATESAMKAGYSKKTAYSIGNENLRKPEIKTYIDEQLKKMDSERVASAEEVMKYLTSVMRGEAQSEIVVIENVGDYRSEARTMSKAPDEKERLRAAELIGKRYALWTDKQQIEGNVPVMIVNDLND